MPSNGIQVAITGEITPTSLSDTFAVTNPYWGLGSLRNVGTNIDRDSITSQRREAGMLVYVQTIDKYFKLDVGLTNLDWIDLGANLGAGNTITTNTTLIGDGTVGSPLAVNTSFAENGLNITSSKLRLGGTLLQNTLINQAGFNFNIDSLFGATSTKIESSSNILGIGPGVGLISKLSASLYSNYVTTFSNNVIIGSSDLSLVNVEKSTITLSTNTGSSAINIYTKVTSSESTSINSDGYTLNILSSDTTLNNSSNIEVKSTSTKITTTSVIYANVFEIFDIYISSSAYVNTRNDGAFNTPLNFLYTDNTGKFLSAPVSMLMPPTPEIILTDKFQDINFSGFIVSLSYLPKDIYYVAENGQILSEDIDYEVNGKDINFFYAKVNKIITIKYRY